MSSYKYILISNLIKFCFRSYKKLLLLFFVAVFFLLVNIHFSHKFYEKHLFIHDLARPILSFESKLFENFDILLGKISTFFIDHDNYNKLIERQELLEAEIARLKFLEFEYEELKKIAGYFPLSNYNYISARIISASSQIFTKSLIIDAGNAQGVKTGNIVINSGGLIGRIIEVGNNSSKVLSLTDIYSNIPAITEISREKIIASGNGSEKLALNYLPDDSKIVNKEAIYTSGDDGLLPPGLLIGHIEIDDGKINIIPSAKWYNSHFVKLILLN